MDIEDAKRIVGMLTGCFPAPKLEPRQEQAYARCLADAKFTYDDAINAVDVFVRAGRVLIPSAGELCAQGDVILVDRLRAEAARAQEAERNHRGPRMTHDLVRRYVDLMRRIGAGEIESVDALLEIRRMSQGQCNPDAMREIDEWIADAESDTIGGTDGKFPIPARRGNLAALAGREMARRRGA